MIERREFNSKFKKWTRKFIRNCTKFVFIESLLPGAVVLVLLAIIEVFSTKLRNKLKKYAHANSHYKKFPLP